MKCSKCGCDKLFEMSIINNQVLATEGYVSQTVRSFACEDCGHIELFAPQELIDKHKECVRQSKEREQEIMRINSKIEAIKDIIIKLESIIADDNQTVKAVKLAQEQLKEAKSGLIRLQQELSNVD